MTCIAVIPARAHSKGLPGKNLKSVAGVSLIGRAVSAAKEAGCFDRIVVTSDGDAILEEAVRCGAEALRRPAELAEDDSRTIDAVEHALRALGLDEGICVLLQPTSPLRTGGDVASAVSLFRSENGGSVVSVCECEHHPYKTFHRDGDGTMRPMLDMSTLEAPRQALPRFFRPNGAIYVNDVSELLSHRTFFVEPVALYEMSEDRSIDIDRESDLKIAEIIQRT